jgi:hypothetical protein
MAKSELAIFPSKAVTASEDGSGTCVEASARRFASGCIALVVSALSAGGSITVTVQDYVGGAWHDLVVFNTAAATGKQISRSISGFGTKLRTIYTLTGASATFAVTGTLDRAN